MMKLRKTEKDWQNEQTFLHRFPLAFWINTLLATILLILVCVPQIQYLMRLQTSFKETIAEAHIIEAATMSRIQAEGEVEQLEEKTILETSILPEEQVIQFIEVFENASAETHVTQRVDLHISQQREQNGILAIPAEIEVSGSWNDILRFLALLEQANFYINPRTITIVNQSIEDHQQSMTMGVLTFWEKSL